MRWCTVINNQVKQTTNWANTDRNTLTYSIMGGGCSARQQSLLLSSVSFLHGDASFDPAQSTELVNTFTSFVYDAVKVMALTWVIEFESLRGSGPMPWAQITGVKDVCLITTMSLCAGQERWVLLAIRHWRFQDLPEPEAYGQLPWKPFGNPSYGRVV